MLSRECRLSKHCLTLEKCLFYLSFHELDRYQTVSWISLVILLSSFVVAGAFWAQHQNEQLGVHRNGVPLKRYSSEIRKLQSKRKATELERRLSELVEASETQHEEAGGGVCPWYYEQLARVYHEAERYVDELSILQRFASQTHPKHPSSARVLAMLQDARGAAVKRGRRRIEEELLMRAARS